MSRLILSCVLQILLLMSGPVSARAADCLSPDGAEGRIIYSSEQNVPMYCNGNQWIAFGRLNPSAGGSGCATAGLGVKAEGHIYYNLDYHVLQYCDGDDWRAVGGGGSVVSGLSGPAGCVSIGDLCADGTVFAGWHPVTQEQLFIPTVDQGTTSVWKTSTGVNDIATDSSHDGRINSNQVANSTTFPAFKLCKDLTAGGYNDWYLPSRVELYYLWAVRGAIESAGNITAFQNTLYWSSTESSTTSTWLQNLPSYGTQNDLPKTLSYRVRCIRR